MKTGVRSISNRDLRPGDIVASPGAEPSESCYRSISLERCVTAEELLAQTATAAAKQGQHGIGVAAECRTDQIAIHCKSFKRKPRP